MKQGIDDKPNSVTQESAMVNPELTQNFVKNALEKAGTGIYRVEVKVRDKVVPIDVYPEVFPPKSDYSVSSHSVFEAFGNLENVEVADIGSGTGIEGIVAILAGAAHVDAADINDVAVACTRHNVKQNRLADKISVYRSDLFSALPKKKYGFIIANLPIVDYKPEKENGIATALYDPGLSTHRRMFREAREYLTKDGIITFTHANLQSRDTENPNKDFKTLEGLIKENGYEIVEKKQSDALGYKWINYKIKQMQESFQ